jgi:hypothetical protein
MDEVSEVVGFEDDRYTAAHRLNPIVGAMGSRIDVRKTS